MLLSSRASASAMDNRGDSDASPFLSIFAALSYGIASMAMVFINKAVLMQYSNSMTLLTLQQLATALLIHFGRVAGYIKAQGVNWETARKLLLVSLFYNANVAFALASLKGVNIPMYIAIKRLTPLAVLVAGFFSGKGNTYSTGYSLCSFDCCWMSHRSHRRLFF